VYFINRFLANKKRLNVALTRSKTALYVVGDLSSLRVTATSWRSVLLVEETGEPGENH
jgi:superfamily I DNA and/or RNA helicase